MKIIVMGAGVLGISSAWYLRQLGHDVQVIDKLPGPGQDTSFANGGQISVSHAEPWATPHAPWQALSTMARADAPVRFTAWPDRHELRWVMRFLNECRPSRMRANTRMLARMGVLSLLELRALRARLNLRYDHAQSGILHVFYRPSDLKRSGDAADLLRAQGIRLEDCDPQRCLDIEPALANSALRPVGGLFAPDDEVGDAHQFCTALAQACAEAGVSFLYDTQVLDLDVCGGDMSGVIVRDAQGLRGMLRADAYVCALGTGAVELLSRQSVSLPIYPLKGHSVTLPAGEGAPHTSLTDESRRIVISRLGNRVRIAGTADLAGNDRAIDRPRCDAILRRALALCPGAGDAARAEYWTGLRPATPGNVPLIGPSRIRGLWFNTGHGSLGWTLACGSARTLADLFAGRAPLEGFEVLDGRRY